MILKSARFLRSPLCRAVGITLATALMAGGCDDDADETPPEFVYEYTPVSTVELDVDRIDHGSCDACDPNASCTARGDAIVCVCQAGWVGDGLSCEDVNECESGYCSENATCTNTQGSFACVCAEGFAGDGVTCNDINECASPALNTCDPNAICTNSFGGFSCTCRPGYSGNGFTCGDINECNTPSLNDCADEAVCTNIPGSYRCACAAGFEGDGRTCVDIDECARGLDNCNVNASCTNTIGSFECACDEGFEGDGVTCDAADGCDPNPCDANASCTNLLGQASCACNTGFEGTGLSCTEIDGCVGDPCDANATCTSSLGIATCTCAEGFEGDGLTCTAIDPCLGFSCGQNELCEDVAGVATCVCPADGFVQIEELCVAVSDSCQPHEAFCEGSCVDTSSDIDFCGNCDTNCDIGEACVESNYTEVTAPSPLTVSLTWDRAGDADLYVLTPNGNLLSWDVDVADGGVHTDADGFGPETVVWSSSDDAPAGTYLICVEAYLFIPAASSTDPVAFAVDVLLGAELVTTFAGSMDYQTDDMPDCSPEHPGYVGSFEWPAE